MPLWPPGRAAAAPAPRGYPSCKHVELRSRLLIRQSSLLVGPTLGKTSFGPTLSASRSIVPANQTIAEQ